MTNTKHEKRSRHNYFSGTVLANPESFIRTSRKILADVEFDTFVVRGMSGAIAGAMLSRSMKKSLYVIRKDNDDSHDGNQPFGDMGSAWVFLDDFIGSGNTFAKTFDRVQDELGTVSMWDWDKSEPIHETREVAPMVGAYLYRDQRFYDREQFTVYMNDWWDKTTRRTI